MEMRNYIVYLCKINTDIFTSFNKYIYSSIYFKNKLFQFYFD